MPSPDAAFDAFVTSRERALVRLGFALTGDRHAAQDLAQHAFLQTWTRWNRIQHDDPYVYARKVLINDVARQRLRKRVVVTPVEDLPEARQSDASVQLEDADRLLTALLALPPRTRAVVVLRYREDLSERQTSDLLSMSVGSVKSHGSRGLAALRQALQPTGSRPRSSP